MDVVVIGAGLAGLRCAGELSQRGYRVQIFDSAPNVGGRVWTDEVDGYLCDRGFQLLNPAYPAVRRYCDIEGLELRPFRAGVSVRRANGTLSTLGDPRREPTLLLASLRSGMVNPLALARLARWGAPALASVQRLTGQGQSEDGDPKAPRDCSLAESLDRCHVQGPLRDEVLMPFLAGVLAEGEGKTSAAFVRLLVRSFLLGTPAVPMAGMRALSLQLAEQSGANLRLNERVLSLDSSALGVEVGTTERERVRADAVVIATDAASVPQLFDAKDDLSGVGMPSSPPMNGLETWWFSVAGTVDESRLLRLDGTDSPVVNSAVVSAAAPEYAPVGRSLVQATTLLPQGASEHMIRERMAWLWGVSPGEFSLVIKNSIPHALPAQPPPLRSRQPVVLGPRLFICGDHRDTASIQGALVSGTRAGRAVAQVLDRR